MEERANAALQVMLNDGGDRTPPNQRTGYLDIKHRLLPEGRWIVACHLGRKECEQCYPVVEPTNSEAGGYQYQSQTGSQTILFQTGLQVRVLAADSRSRNLVT